MACQKNPTVQWTEFYTKKDEGNARVLANAVSQPLEEPAQHSGNIAS